MNCADQSNASRPLLCHDIETDKMKVRVGLIRDGLF